MPEIKRMSMPEYQAAPGISASGLNLIHRSPAHYKENRDNPSESTAAMIFGSMFHTLALEPELFKVEYAVLPSGLDRRTKEGKAIYADFQIENVGKQMVSADDYVAARNMVKGLRSHSRANQALAGGQAELSIFWQAHGPDGLIDCKSRLDYVTESGVIVDLKTTTDARIDPFSRQCWQLGYHRKAAFYMDAYKAMFGKEAEGFLFIALEKEPPYGTALYLLDETASDQGRREYIHDLNAYAECLKNDLWPCYPDEVMAILLPAWARDDQNFG